MKLSTINNGLLTLTILINGYIILAPLAPSLLFHWHNQAREQSLLRQIKPSKKNVAVDHSNRLIIPSMVLDQPVLEGSVRQQYKVLNAGIWRWPQGSSPDKGGNTVLIGHRFTYTNPRGVFYYLDKVKVGDRIGVVWQGKNYLYQVTSTEVVKPNDTSIEDQTNQSKLTLFTCTPLWLPKNRLVVVANSEKVR